MQSSKDPIQQGNAHYEAGQLKEAISDRDCAIELDPEDAEAYNDWGVAKSALGQLAEAKSARALMQYSLQPLPGMTAWPARLEKY
ncbi:MAG: tetratricopeptide repeat protein [Caldilineaceae bacterium]|nr:tetratricopeptide repeat protein [Caldilineaceae bacterium]